MSERVEVRGHAKEVLEDQIVPGLGEMIEIIEAANEFEQAALRSGDPAKIECADDLNDSTLEEVLDWAHRLKGAAVSVKGVWRPTDPRLAALSQAA